MRRHPLSRRGIIFLSKILQKRKIFRLTQIHDNHGNSTSAVTSATDDTDIAIMSVRLSVCPGHSRIMSKRLKGVEIGRVCAATSSAAAVE